MNINSYIKKNIGKLGKKDKDVYISPSIPERKLKNVIKSFECEDFYKNIVAIYDNTVFGAADEGLVFTGERMIYKAAFEKPMTIYYKDLKDVKYVKKTENKKTEEYVIFYFKDGSELIFNKSFVGDFTYKAFSELLNGIIQFGRFTESNLLKEIAEMSEEIKILYLKILTNMAYSDDNEVDKKELAELFLLMTRIKMSTKSRYLLREYIVNISDENREKTEKLLIDIRNYMEDIENGSYENLEISLIKDMINLYFSTKTSKENYKNISINDIKFIKLYRQFFDINDKQLEFIVESIKNDYALLYEDVQDDVVKKQMKELIAKGGAVGVPLAAIYISGSVIGFSAAGITSGLAALGLGLGMTGGIAAVAILGVLTYKGVKYITGADEVEKYKFKEMMLQDVIKQMQKTMSFIIEDVNFLINKLNVMIESHDRQSQKIQKLVSMIAQFQGALENVDNKAKNFKNSSLRIKCPKVLDVERLKELTDEPMKKEFYNYIVNNYRKENNTNNWVLKDNIDNDTLENMANIFQGIGYFDVKNIATSKITSTFKKVWN